MSASIRSKCGLLPVSRELLRLKRRVRPALRLALLAAVLTAFGHAQVQIAGLSPSSGTYSSGVPIVFTMTGYASDAWNNSNDYLILEISPLTSHPWASACNIQYQPYYYKVWLTKDDGNSWDSGQIGSNQVLSNSQCSVNLALATASVSVSSTGLTVVLPVTLASNYTGTQYLSVDRYQGSHYWVDVGAISVPATTQVAAPTFSPAGGSYSSAQTVTLRTATPGATIRYTTDNSTPTSSWGTAVTPGINGSAITVSGFTPLKAMAYRSGWTDSSVTTAIFTNSPSLPTDLVVSTSPVSGTYSASNSVTTSGVVTAQSGSGALFQAGGLVRLLPGFQAVTGSSFRAAIGPPDFILSAAPASGYNGSVVAGSATSYTITATSLFAFSDAITLSPTITSLPSGATVSFTNNTLIPPPGGSASTTMTITTNGSAVPQTGAFVVGVSGTSGALQRTANASLNVTPLNPVDFYFSVSPALATVTPPSTTQYSVTVSLMNGFNSPITYGLLGLPAGASYTYTSVPGAPFGVQWWTLTINPGTAVGGTYDLVITGTGGGLTRTYGVQLKINRPITHTITTSPLTGMQIYIDGSWLQSPQTVTWQPGDTHTIGTLHPQDLNGVRYSNATWSDGGALTHSVLAPSSATTYTVTFAITHYSLTTIANPANGGTISPASGWYAPNTQVPVSAYATGTNVFSGFTGALSGTATPQTVTMTGPKSVTANFGATGSVTITSSPSGRTFTVDGGTYSTPQTFSWATDGSSHSVSFDTPQPPGATGTRYTFDKWHDGPTTNPRGFVASSTPATYQADFKTQYQLTTAVSPAGSGTITPASGGWYDADSSVPVSASPTGTNQFVNYTGGLTGTNPSQSVPMDAPKSVTANFQAAATYSISGTIVAGPNSTPVSGVTVTLTGGPGGSATTNTSGVYTVPGLPAGGNYTVTPTLSGHTFCPTSKTVTGLSSNQTAVNFNADGPTREYVRLGGRVIAIEGCSAQ